jgi:hypothetical protein
MKAKDLIYIAIIGGLGYLLFFNKKKTKSVKSSSTEDVVINGISDAPLNNSANPELFGIEGEGEPVKPIVEETISFQNQPVESFTIPYPNYSCTYSKNEGRFYLEKNGVLIKTSKSEITETDYLKALNYYNKKIVPCLN